VRRPGGYLVVTDRISGLVTREADTITCAHCNTVIAVPPGSNMSNAGYCLRCSKATCAREACQRCTPFEQKLEQAEARERFHRRLG
jgi:hypothetical protein